jgi:glutathione synthase
MMAQKFIPEISAGDKRVLLINGEPLSYVLARVPAPNQWRGNLAAGATGVIQPLAENDKRICETVGPVLREKGLYFVGLDIIGNYLTEINVTSPTCIRELDAGAKINITAQLFDFIEKYINK